MTAAFSHEAAAIAFLSRDPHANREALLTLRYQFAAALHTSIRGAEVRGVLLRGPGPLHSSPVWVRIDALDADAVHDLLHTATLAPPMILAIHRPWIGELLRREYGWQPDGSGWLSYLLDRDRLVSHPDTGTRLLDRADAALVEHSACGWSRAYFDHLFAEGRRPWAVVRDGRIVCRASSGYPHAGSEEVVGVWTHDQWRGRGLARAVVSAAAADILTRCRYAAYTTTFDNPASQAVARVVGFQPCAIAHNFPITKQPRAYRSMNHVAVSKWD
jgi:GNAT superfamily N-acetyltransferase